MKQLSVFLLLCLSLASCRKDSFNTSPGATLNITTDKLTYDTVFTGTGSVTKSFKIINDNKQKIRINSVQLMGGANSSFSMNVDGLPGTNFSDLVIEGNDSLYVFVQVNVDPGAADLPFIIEDSIQVTYNGNTRQVDLEAWGQNANFLRDEEITGTVTWTNNRPYVILGYLHVNEGAQLNIAKGCRIYLHADAPIVIDGTLKTMGEKDSIDRIWFRGDRLDDPYKNYPASWPGIFFTATSSNNELNFTNVLNAYQALVVDGPAINANPKLVLNECHVDNAYDVGLLAQNSSIAARNCLFSNSGKNVVVQHGGEYSFVHCTLVSIGNNFIPHKDPALSLYNYDENNSPAPLTASFVNCIFWGENGQPEDEVVIGKTGNTLFNVTFEFGLWKMSSVPAGVITTNMYTSSPGFVNTDASTGPYDFRLTEDSPAIDQGVASTLNLDLDGNPRPVGSPDLGCFERQ